jgi:hypothetical protein
MIIKRSGYFLQLIFFAAILICSCNKTDDGTPPPLHIFSPDDHAVYSVGDSIHVVGTVTHKFTVKSIKIILWDNFNVPVLDPLYVYPNDYGYNLDEMYPINDASLESGTYILLIAASDGQNTRKVYRTLHITGVLRYFERLLVVGRPNTLKTILYAVDTAGNYLISHDTGIYHYIHASKTLVELLPGVDANAIAYDHTRLLLYFAENEKISVYRVDNAEIIDEIILPYPVLDLHIQYNN